MNQLAPLSPALALPALIASADAPAQRRFLEFFAGGRRGIARARRVWSTEQGDGEPGP